MHIVFHDADVRRLCAFETAFRKHTLAMTTDFVTDIDCDFTHVVPNASCFGVMDATCFDDTVVGHVRTCNLKTKQERYYLPIGSALTIPTTGPILVFAPTMLGPSDIRTTDNVYHAFLAVLQVVPEDAVVLVPLLGTRYGSMPARESADAIADAISSYSEGKRASHYDTAARVSHGRVVTTRCVCPQRNDALCNHEVQ